ncbi:Capsule biosynthesis protein CapA [Paenibacillus konkukensis]|uniref:Capsule biosynthesis protein CapA n=1 Tax=Paenibacillus konkukensis TaxID=2020716 RepID=A0ABY4RLU8_9BACL|nr:CapA family protein [Paenibacillus konkukensis]UQZ82856.1 Capsule biosynthesis protein CapA [Paenibacillus konkukensis]
MAVITLVSFSYLMNWLSRDDLPEGAAPPVQQQPSGTSSAPSPAATNVQEGGQPPTEAVQPDASKQESEIKSGVKLTFIGDVMFAGKVEDLLKKNGWDYPFRYVKDFLTPADITVANLETPLTERGTAESKDYVYRSSPQALPVMQAAGIDLVNTANNHIMDYGPEGLLDTLDELDKAGMKRVGTGRNSDEAYQSVIMERSGIKIAFLGFSRVAENADWYAGNDKPGVAETYNAKLPLEAVAKAREQADLVVVIAHWGIERKDRPVKEQTDLAHKYIDAGADLVIGGHPHVLQGFERYKGKWIAYSLGNFIFTTNEVPETWESMVLDAECTKEGSCSLQMVPILTKWAQPVRMTDEDGANLFERMGRISINASVDKDGVVTEAEPVKPAPTPTPAAKKQTEPKKESGGSPSSGITAGSGGSAKPQQTDKPKVSPKPSTKPSPTPTPSTKPTPKPSSKPAAKPTPTPTAKSSPKPSPTPAKDGD